MDAWTPARYAVVAPQCPRVVSVPHAEELPGTQEYMINKDTGIAVNEWEPTRDGMTISVVTKRLGEIEEKVQGLVFSCVEVRNHGQLPPVGTNS